jgi:uncharacterized phage protein gp47/JayE
VATSAEISIAPLPTTEEVALTLIQWLFATIGVPTDYNIGSIVRTLSEAMGSVEEIEGVEAQAQALQALVYSAYSAFGISPLPATGAVGNVTFSTLSQQPLPSGQSVLIPLNSIIQTAAGIQFTTTTNAVLVSGTISISVPIQAISLGAASNVPSNTVNQLVTGLAYPLSVTNPLPTAGGFNAETPSQTLARFTAYVQSLGLCSPVAIAGAVIGVNNNQEYVRYSTVYEPWIVEVEMGDPTPTAGYQVIIDNGAGNASPQLIANVISFLDNGTIGTQQVGLITGYRPAGVPFTVSAVTPVSGSVVVVATSINPALVPSIQTGVGQAIVGYFNTLNFGDTAQITQLIASIANVTFGQLTSLSVTLLNGASVSVQNITAGPVERVILTGYSVTVN